MPCLRSPRRPPTGPDPTSPPAGRPTPPAHALRLPRAAALGALLTAALGCGARRGAAPLPPPEAALPRVPTAPVPVGCTVLVHIPAGDGVSLPEGTFGLRGEVLPAVAGARCLLSRGAAGAPLRWSWELPGADLGPLRCAAAGSGSPTLTLAPGAALPAGAALSASRDLHEVQPQVLRWTPCPWGSAP